MATIKDLKTREASSAEMADLQKAMQTTATAEKMIEVDYDDELQRLVYAQSPFLSYLEQNDIVQPANSAIVGYRVKNRKTTSTFIGETEAIPEHDGSDYSDETARMKTLVYPIEVSDLAQRGVDIIDLLEDELTDAYLDMAEVKDKTVLQGVGGNGAKDFTGLFPSITTHVDNSANGEPITKEQIDDLAQEIIQDGGMPSAIVTTPLVGKQINDILYPTLRNVDKVELPLGYNVTAYIPPNGVSIPIIVDPNIDTTNGDSLAIIDNSALRIRELQPPTVTPLAKTKLAESQVLYTWFTFYNRAEYKCGAITGIGAGN